MAEDIQIPLFQEPEEGKKTAGQLLDEWVALKNAWENANILRAQIEATMDQVARTLGEDFGVSVAQFRVGSRQVVGSSEEVPDDIDDEEDYDEPVVEAPRGRGRPRKASPVIESTSPAVGAGDSYLPPLQGPAGEGVTVAIDPVVAQVRKASGVAEPLDDSQSFGLGIMAAMEQIQRGLGNS